MKIRSVNLSLICAVFVVLQPVCCKLSDQWKVCDKGVIEKHPNKSSWTLGCSGAEITTVIEMKEIDLNCRNRTNHGLITISKFPLKKLCRLKQGTCFLFTSELEREIVFPLTAGCGSDMYWTEVKNLSSLYVRYETLNGRPAEAKFALHHITYRMVTGRSLQPPNDNEVEADARIRTESKSSTEQVLAIAFGCFCALLVFALIFFVARSRRKDAKAKRHALENEYKRGSKHPLTDPDASEREVVVNQLYEM